MLNGDEPSNQNRKAENPQALSATEFSALLSECERRSDLDLLCQFVPADRKLNDLLIPEQDYIQLARARADLQSFGLSNAVKLLDYLQIPNLPYHHVAKEYQDKVIWGRSRWATQTAPDDSVMVFGMLHVESLRPLSEAHSSNPAHRLILRARVDISGFELRKSGMIVDSNIEERLRTATFGSQTPNSICNSTRIFEIALPARKSIKFDSSIFTGDGRVDITAVGSNITNGRSLNKNISLGTLHTVINSSNVSRWAEQKAMMAGGTFDNYRVIMLGYVPNLERGASYPSRLEHEAELARIVANQGVVNQRRLYFEPKFDTPGGTVVYKSIPGEIEIGAGDDWTQIRIRPYGRNGFALRNEGPGMAMLRLHLPGDRDEMSSKDQ